jgi:hypothetical protein
MTKMEVLDVLTEAGILLLRAPEKDRHPDDGEVFRATYRAVRDDTMPWVESLRNFRLILRDTESQAVIDRLIKRLEKGSDDMIRKDGKGNG